MIGLGGFVENCHLMIWSKGEDFVKEEYADQGDWLIIDPEEYFKKFLKSIIVNI